MRNKRPRSKLQTDQLTLRQMFKGASVDPQSDSRLLTEKYDPQEIVAPCLHFSVGRSPD